MTVTYDSITSALPLERLALNLISVGTEHPFEEILDACVRHGIQTISPWRQHYEATGAQRAGRAIADRGLSVNSICRMAEFAGVQTSADMHAALDEARKLVDEAVAMRARSITFTGGGITKGAKDIAASRERIREGIASILPVMRAAGVTLAIEALHPMAADRGGINTLKQATTLAKEVGDGAAVMVDAYNIWWDPDLASSIENARGLITGFQVSDWLLPTTHLAFDRGMMGDGVIDLRGIRAMVEATGYDGHVEVEILSANNWALKNLDEVIGTIKKRFVEYC